MLTFLRRIRKGLIGSSSVRKYLLYATGEIALVVIGILIALQINNWNEYRKDRVVEQEILREIMGNIELNIDFIKFNMKANEKSTYSFEILKRAYESGKPWADSLSRHIGSALVVHPPTLSFSAFESLKSLGFDIILSNAMRKEIVDLFEVNYNDLTTVESRIINIELKPPIADLTTGNFEHELTSNGKLLKPNNPATILQNQKFRNVLTNIQWYRNRIFSDLETRSLEESQRVLQLIDDQLQGAEGVH